MTRIVVTTVPAAPLMPRPPATSWLRLQVAVAVSGEAAWGAAAGRELAAVLPDDAVPCAAGPCVAGPGEAEQPAMIPATAHATMIGKSLITTASFALKGRGNDVKGWTVIGQADIRMVSAADLVEEAVTWSIRRRAASAVVAETLDQVLAAIPARVGPT